MAPPFMPDRAQRPHMAGVLNLIYSLAVLLVAVGGVVFVFTQSGGEIGESKWSRWGELAAVVVFLVAMVALVLMAA